MAKQLSYTSEQEARMAEVFDASRQDEVVKELAAEFGKSTKSVVAKLAQLGLYKAKSKAKAKGDRVTKADRASDLARALVDHGILESDEAERVSEDLVKLRVESLAALETFVFDRRE